MPSVLLVDDDHATLTALTVLVEKLGFTATAVSTWSDARNELLSRAHDVALLDVFLPGGSGIDLLLEVPQSHRPQVVLMSGDESVGKAFSTLALQELHFVAKPVDPRVLSRCLAKVRRRCRVEDAANTPAEVPGRERGAGRLVGTSAAMERVRSLIERVAPSAFSVYIEGESGTGKELVAVAIHELSSRCDGPFVALNCGAVPENLIDSELFGHTKGAFTGAASANQGVFQQANGGTLFLDEIAEMPIDHQVRLLRALETGRVRPVGSSQDVEVDVRIISATNRHFEQSIRDGDFREDLFHRLCVFPIVTPPLRDRPEDIPLLAQRFLDELAVRFKDRKRFAPETVAALEAYAWPGNVRQLRNAVQRAFVMADGVITPDSLPTLVLNQDAAVRRQPAAALPGASANTIQVPVGSTIAAVERRLIEATLAHSSGDKRAAAEMLGMSLRTLYSRLKEYGAPTEPMGDGAG